LSDFSKIWHDRLTVTTECIISNSLCCNVGISNTSAGSTNLEISTSTTTMTPSCSLWTRRTNTTADSAAFYDWMSESHCKAACLTMSSCVAVYTTSAACFLHHNTDNLTATRPAAGVTQFVLNRHCLPSGVTATPTTSSTASNFSFGNTV